NCLVAREHVLLIAQLVRGARSSQPLVTNDRRKHDFIRRDQPAKTKFGGTRSAEGADQDRCVEQNHSTGVLRPPLRRAALMSSISRCTSSADFGDGVRIISSSACS